METPAPAPGPQQESDVDQLQGPHLCNLLRHLRNRMEACRARQMDGKWKDGDWHGYGTMTHADGRVYVGEYKDDKRHGYGKFTRANGSIYHDGMWKDDKPKDGNRVH